MSRNFIAKAVKRIPHKIVPDKREKMRKREDIGKLHGAVFEFYAPPCKHVIDVAPPRSESHTFGKVKDAE